MARNLRLSLEVDEGYRIRIVDAQRVVIESPRGGRYRVDLERGVCNSPGGTFRGRCKHVAFARRLVDLLGDSVPEAVGMMKG